MGKGLKVLLTLVAVALMADRRDAGRQQPFRRERHDRLRRCLPIRFLDGSLVSDGESLRPINQIFEGLVGLKPGSTDLVPLLATSWTASRTACPGRSSSARA